MFMAQLGGETWIPLPGATVPFWQIGAERFASMLSWSYWPSTNNADDTFAHGIRNPAGTTTTPARFKILLGEAFDT